MKSFLLALAVLLSASAAATAQSNSKPGYIVTFNGDTTKGFVDYKQWSHRNPASILFKDLSNVEKTFSVNDITAFGVEAENYKALTVSLSQNTLSLENLTNKIDTSSITRKVFLRVIVAAQKLSLFFYEDERKQRYYVAERDATPFELLRYKYISPLDNTKIIERDTYREQLQRLATTYQPDNAWLNSQVQNVSYNEHDLKNIVLLLNGGLDVKYVEPKGSAVRFFVGLAANATAVHFKGSVYESLGKHWSYSPQLSVGLDVLARKSLPRFFLRMEFNASYSEASFFDNTLVNATKFEQEFSYTSYSFGIAPQLVFNLYNTEKTKFYLAGGVLAYYSAYKDKVNELRTTAGSEKETYQAPIGPARLDPGGLQLLSRFGVTTPKFQFFAGYNLPVNIVAPIGYSIFSESYVLGINYLIGAK